MGSKLLFLIIFNQIYFFAIQNRQLKLDQLHKKKNVREFNRKAYLFNLLYLTYLIEKY